MKVFLEQYGQFIVSIIIGICLFGLLYATTIKNTEIMDRLIPDERNMILKGIENNKSVNSKEIPVIELADHIVVLIDPKNAVKIDYLSPSILHKAYADGNETPINDVKYVSMKYARVASKLKPNCLNIIGRDAVNTKVRGDYKVTYYYYNSNTGYKQIEDLTICVRRPYEPYQFIYSETGTQEIDTRITPYIHLVADEGGTPYSSSLTIECELKEVGKHQDIVWTKPAAAGENLRFNYGIYVENGFWGYKFGDTSVKTNIAAQSGTRYSVTLDLANRMFIVDGTGGRSIPLDFANIKINGIKVFDSTGKTTNEYKNAINALEHPEEGITDNGYIMLLNASQQIKAKIYSCQIYKGEALRRNMIAAYAKTNNMFGLWDTVSWSAFYNENQVYPSFSYGDRIED